ncbi:MAG: sulfurtransferase TusA family protein [Pseudomonadota bacterium]
MAEKRTLDTKGMRCPIPVLKARRAMRELEDGDVLTVLATDPASYIDFQHFCDTTGHEMLDAIEDKDEGVFTYVIRCVK